MRPLLLSLLLAALACEPSTPVPTPVMVMSVSGAGVYEPHPVQLSTASDVVKLRGAAARLVGGARIVDDSNELQRQTVTTEEELRLAIVKNAGLDPRASFIERDFVLWPADFHTWNMVTTYYNFEKAFRYFQDNGFTLAEATDPVTGFGPTVYYFPSFILADVSADELRDNALYFPPIKAFAVLPFDGLQAVPLSMNSGIIAHEYGHLVFNKRVYGGASIPIPFTTAWVPEGGFASPPSNIMRALDEGLADFHAFGASCGTDFGCTTRFLEPSVGSDITDQRDFNQDGKCMDQNLRNAIGSLGFGAFISQGWDYRLGTVFAKALYEASNPSQLQTMERALLAAYSDDDSNSQGLRQLVEGNAQTPGNVTLGAVATSILQHISDPTLKQDTCSAFMDYLQIRKEEMIAPPGAVVACPAAAAKTNNCPNINP